jgi:hypothetical protein
MPSKSGKVANNIAKPWQPWKAASLTTLGSLAALPFFTTYKAINNIAKPWQPWLAALPVLATFWQPYQSRLQDCQPYPSGGSVGAVDGSGLSKNLDILPAGLARLASVYKCRQSRARAHQ